MGELREQIEEVNAVVFPGINDGVYRCWFAQTDEAYAEGYSGLRSALEWFEKRVQNTDYLCGGQLTLADVRAFPHLFRFDVIYHKLMLRDPRGEYLKGGSYPAILAWLERVGVQPPVKAVCDLAVAAHFYLSEPDSECDELYKTLKYSWMPS